MSLQIRGIVCSVLSNVQELYREKDLKVSRAKFVEAEREYDKGDYKKSLMFYSQSILRSPPTNLLNPDSGYSLALALYGRAKALIKLGEYSFALSDLQLAMKENLPSDVKGDVFWNMGICHKAKGDFEKAKISFGVAEKLVKDAKKLERLKKDCRSNNYFEKSSKQFKGNYVINKSKLVYKDIFHNEYIVYAFRENNSREREKTSFSLNCIINFISGITKYMPLEGLLPGSIRGHIVFPTPRIKLYYSCFVNCLITIYLL